MHTLTPVIRSDPGTASLTRVRVLNFAQKEWKRAGGGHTWCVTGGCSLPAKGPTKTCAAWSRAAAAARPCSVGRIQRKTPGETGEEQRRGVCPPPSLTLFIVGPYLSLFLSGPAGSCGHTDDYGSIGRAAHETGFFVLSWFFFPSLHFYLFPFKITNCP